MADQATAAAAAPKQQRTWFITGCSSGFGELLVRKLRIEGDNVIATGRRAEERLANLKETGARVMDLDVTAPEAKIREVAAEAWAAFPGGVDVVVNNAGYIVAGLIENLTQEQMDECLKTNLHGPLNVTRAFLPYMREKGTGTLVFMGSQAGWFAEVYAGAYCTSKFALEGAVESLSKELAIVAPGIKVLLVEPGYFRTDAFLKVRDTPQRVPALAGLHAAAEERGASIPGTEPGDPAKAVERIAELVRGDGMVAGKELSLRVPLGTDGWEKIKGKCEETLAVCEKWEEVAKSTDW